MLGCDRGIELQWTRNCTRKLQFGSAAKFVGRCACMCRFRRLSRSGCSDGHAIQPRKVLNRNCRLAERELAHLYMHGNHTQTQPHAERRATATRTRCDDFKEPTPHTIQPRHSQCNVYAGFVRTFAFTIPTYICIVQYMRYGKFCLRLCAKRQR